MHGQAVLDNLKSQLVLDALKFSKFQTGDLTMFWTKLQTKLKWIA